MNRNQRRAVIGALAAPGLIIIASAPAGDFDHDGFDDAAIGAPFDSAVANRPNSGTVTIIRGSKAGLTSKGSILLSLNTPGVAGDPASEDEFGSALADGDFNGDGFADLAVGVPRRKVGTVATAGEVVIFFGSANGLSGVGSQVFSQDTAGINDLCETADTFGAALATGDFNDDGFADLAVGVPGESTAAASRAGAVAIIFGSPHGLTATGDQFWTQDSTGVPDSAEADDHFGRVLAAGDFNADGRDDLAIGVPDEDLGAVNQGAVNLLPGSPTGLTAKGSQLWSQDSSGIAGVGEADDHFGFSLATGEFGNGVAEDLAVGVPFEDGAAPDAGGVNIIYGGPGGLASANNKFFSQNSAGILDLEEDGDRFGFSLGAGRINADHFSDLVVGIPFEGVGAVAHAGAIAALYGSSAGITGTGDQFLHQDTAGILDLCEADDNFGFAVSVTDGPSLDGDGFADVVIGISGEEGAANDSGAIAVLRGAAGHLVTTANQFMDQDTTGIPGVSEETDRWGNVLGPR